MKPLLVLVAVGLLVYALIDCSRAADADLPSGLPRAVWLLVLIVVPIVGPAWWIVASRSQASRPGPRGRTPLPRGPVGPDDDPDFLRHL